MSVSCLTVLPLCTTYELTFLQNYYFFNIYRHMHTLTQPPWWTVLLTSFPLAEMQNWDLNSNSLYCSVSLCIPSQKWPFLKREKSGTCMNQPFLLGITQRKKKITLRTTKHWSRLHGWLCSLCLWRFSSQTKP